MGGAIAGGKAWPSPGVMGTGLGTQNQLLAAAPANQAPLQPTPSINPARALTPTGPNQGRSLLAGQPAFPTGQSPLNPWGINRGGSGAIPLSRRPGTLPASRIAR